MSAEGELLKGSILIEEGKIKGLGQIPDTPVDRIIDGYNHVALPGLFNAHTHLSMVYFRNYGTAHATLQEWLTDVWALEELLQSQDIYSASLLGIAEMILSGTTHFRDMYFYPEGTVEAAYEAKIKGTIGLTLFGDITETNRRLQKVPFFRELTPPLRWEIAPHSIYTCSEATLRRAIEVASLEAVPLHIHVSETRQEVEEALEKFKMSPVAYLHSLKTHKVKSTLPHCVHLLEGDFPLLQQFNTTVVHNPSSNCKLGCGIAEVGKLNALGIPLALGTDGAASNNALDMFNEIRLAALLASLKHPLSPYTLLKMACAGNTLEVGKDADLFLLDLDRPHLSPLNDLFSALVFSAKSSDVKYVFCRGELLLDNRALTTIDIERTQASVNNIWKAIKRR